MSVEPKDLGIEDEGLFLFNPGKYGFIWATEEEIFDQRRWVTCFTRVAKRLSDETYWDFSWELGSTECQEVDLELTIQQVFPKQVTQTIYTTKTEN
jgi:hypothetical protein